MEPQGGSVSDPGHVSVGPNQHGSGSRDRAEYRKLPCTDVVSVDQLNDLTDFRGTFRNHAIDRGAHLGMVKVEFSDGQVGLMRSFADQAVIAIENARLFAELQERNGQLTEALEQQTATAEVLRVISSSPGDLAPVFDAMLANATRLCEASYGNLWLCEGDLFRSSGCYGWTSDFIDQWRYGTAFRPGPHVPAAYSQTGVG